MDRSTGRAPLADEGGHGGRWPAPKALPGNGERTDLQGAYNRPEDMRGASREGLSGGSRRCETVPSESEAP